MKRPILVGALFCMAAAAALGAQEASQSDSYQGVSNPPPDDTIVTSSTPQPKPPAGHPAYSRAADPVDQAPPVAQERPSSIDPSVNYPDPDGGMVQVRRAPPETPRQGSWQREEPLQQRRDFSDPDGDIVHPHPLGPNELGVGTTIRVRLLARLSTASSEQGEPFRGRVATDVLRDGMVLIPAGTEIDGRVVAVSTGHPGGYGTMRLRPETLLMSDGTRFRLHATVTGAPGSRTRIGSEGAIRPTSRLGRDGVEYGGAVGAGAVTGAILAGPAGALTGTLIGAGVVTAHLLVSHPQATLEAGTTLLITLSDRLSLSPANANGN